MKRILLCENDRQPKQVKVQRTITSMFRADGPKFVETTGVQLVCPYCGHKFRAPQGLVSHKHMHERAGDKILSKVKPNLFKFSAKPSKSNPQDMKMSHVAAVAPVSTPPLPVVKREGIKIEDPGKQIIPA